MCAGRDSSDSSIFQLRIPFPERAALNRADSAVPVTGKRTPFPPCPAKQKPVQVFRTWTDHADQGAPWLNRAGLRKAKPRRRSRTAYSAILESRETEVDPRSFNMEHLQTRALALTMKATILVRTLESRAPVF